MAAPKQLLSQVTTATARDERVIHIIGHSHIDAAWLWPWKDSADLVLTTFRSALDRMQETPGFRYSHSSAVHYRWVQRAAPEMFAEILARIREGRWEIVGGWPVEPDCNIPSTESFVRHCMYGKRYCQQVLGAQVDIGFNPDSFGHAAGLPSILKQAGYKYYVFMRPQEHEMTLPRLFWWEGPDGSRVLTYRIYGDYDRGPSGIFDAATHGFPDGAKHSAFFMGVGDHGGAVTARYIQQILAMQGDPSLPILQWSTLSEFFVATNRSLSLEKLPVIRGDLQHHARGCYSACGDEKFQNRRAEHAMFRAESIDVSASLAHGQSSPAGFFADAWGRVLFNQFHDILAGTSLYSDYQDARDGIGFACEMAEECKVSQLEQIAKRVDLHDVSEGAIFVWNPLPWRRWALLEFHYATDSTAQRFIALKARDGGTTDLQLRASDSMTNFYPRLSAWVELPACGYRVFTLERDGQTQAQPFSKHATISSDAFGLKSLCALDGTELLSGNLGLVVIEDKSDTWAHGVAAFRRELGRPSFVTSEVVEDGPVTRVTRQRLRWRTSDIVVEIAEFTATRTIELRFVIDWREHEQILKLEVPTRFLSPKVFAKVPGAALQRAPDGNEEPYQDWVAVEGSLHGSNYSLALMNRSTYSYDCLQGLLRTILIRSAPYARHNPNVVQEDGVNAWQDQGRQERTFWLSAEAGIATRLDLDRRALEMQTPVEYVLDSRHHGTEGWDRSFLEITPSNVEVLAVKRAEDTSEVIVRLQERSGENTVARISLPSLGVATEIPLRPWEILSLALSFSHASGVQARAVSSLETDLLIT